MLPGDTNFSRAVYVVRRWQPGGRYDGTELSRGQLINLLGKRNDELLTKHGFLRKWEGKKTDAHQCGECGGFFESEPARRQHGDVAHKTASFEGRPDLEDEMIDSQAAQLDRQVPFENAGAQVPLQL